MPGIESVTNCRAAIKSVTICPATAATSDAQRQHLEPNSNSNIRGTAATSERQQQQQRQEQHKHWGARAATVAAILISRMNNPWISMHFMYRYYGLATWEHSPSYFLSFERVLNPKSNEREEKLNFALKAFVLSFNFV